jgi:hypothetical protein
MQTSDSRFETGMFYNRHDAETTVKLLHELGYENDEISVVMSDDTRAREFAAETGSKVPEGATAGGIVGGALGAILAGLTATGAIVTMVGTGGLVAPVIVGPLAAVLAGLGAGGLAGGIIGALIGAGIPEDRAREIEEGVNRGGIMVGVRPHEEDRDRVSDIFSRRTSTTPATTTTTGEIDRTDLTTEDDMVPRRTI